MMNQRRSGGGNRPQQRELTENEKVSLDQKRQQQMTALFRDIKARRGHIEAVLPTDIPFQKFEACLAMAIRREPKLLECYGPSLIKAAIQSAYDGLMPDGKEAVILYRWNNKEKRLEANYQSMAYGLRKKIVEVGAAKHIEATVVYKNEPFRYSKGLNPILEHEPILDDERRGDLWAVYSVATLPDGERVFEVMTKGDVMAVKAVAMTTDVWDKWPAEMWRKSVLRRHSKALPTARPIRDAEALEMFPQFANQGHAALPAQGSAPPRPAAADFAQLEDRTSDGLDLSGFMEGAEEERETVEVEQKTDAKPATATKAKEQPAAATETAGPSEQAIPNDPEGWSTWQTQVKLDIGKCRDSASLADLQTRNLAIIKAAPKPIREATEKEFLDKRLDLEGEEG
jgi:recombination protein RecT